MTAPGAGDDELRIRHVRLCECGLPAGHDSVCQPGMLAAARAVEQAWAESNAELRAKRHGDRQPGFRAARLEQRARMTARQLRALADVRARKLSTVSAGNVAPSHGTTQHPSVNLALQAPRVMLDTDPRWRAAEKAEKTALMRLHELLDEYEGLGVAHAERELTAEQKDAEICSPSNAHLSAFEFSVQFPGYGSPRSVSRKRAWFRAGRCTFNGLAPQSSCRCPTCRHASG